MLACGFQKKDRHWFLNWRGDCMRRVAVGLRTVSGRDEGWIAVTVGVGFRSLDELLSRCPSIDHRYQDPDMPCAIATLTERLRGIPQPTIQWRILPDVDPDLVGPEVVTEIREWALPFLDRYSSLEQAIAAWESGKYYGTRTERDEYLAAAHCVRGDPDRAIQVIKEGSQFCQQRLQERARPPWAEPYDPDIERYEKLLHFL
jgi:hypothetical protein